MELRQLLYFVEVAKHEHMTKASEQLHVAQSAISRQITNLEDELGVELFNRMGRNLHLSKIGNLYLSQVKIALNELKKAENIVSEYANPEIGTVKIGFPTSLATNLLPTLISSFREKYPNINYEFVEGSNKELNENLLSGNLDLTFFSPLPIKSNFIDTFTFF
ncbi:transcriptional activator of the glutamate synthase operon [Brochothrix thermosphacta DSM 20171 = FSL F6-1036]|nr:transcriptional activator of the glutamate synthase operon [Brochothrix thermosphacta DSM 20171 = FSL F6-1036]